MGRENPTGSQKENATENDEENGQNEKQNGAR